MRRPSTVRLVPLLLAVLLQPNAVPAAPSCVAGVDSEVLQFDKFTNQTTQRDLVDRLKGTVACVTTRRYPKGKGTLQVDSYGTYIRLPLDYQEQHPMVYWPSRADLITYFDHHSRLPDPQDPSGCAEVGELQVWNSYVVRLRLALPHDSDLTQYTFQSDAADFTQPPSGGPGLACVNPRGLYIASVPVTFKVINVVRSVTDRRGLGCIRLYKGGTLPIAQIPIESLLKNQGPLALSDYIGNSCNSKQLRENRNNDQLQKAVVQNLDDQGVLPFLADGSVAVDVGIGP